ncbi:MAG: AraC family transcriptional regulator [Pseudomonadota bacterium]
MAIDNDLFQRLCRARDHLTDSIEEAPTLRGLARLAGISPHHLLRVFRGAFGETPHGFLTSVRISRAKARLRAGRSVTETCFDVGFASLGSFSAKFRRAVGVSPSEYRRQLRAAAPSSGQTDALTVPFCFLQAFAPASVGIATMEKPLPFRP